MEDLSAFSARPRLRALLDHFAEIHGCAAGPGRSCIRCARYCSWWCKRHGRESGDDYEDIVD